MPEQPNNNFKVAVRIRPNLPNDIAKVQYKIPSKNQLIVDYPHQGYSHNTKNRKFNFDNIFQKSSNTHIFDKLVKPQLKGFGQRNKNMTILTYGITGSGKTHTIFGEQNEQGLAVLCFKELLLNDKSEQSMQKFRQKKFKYYFSYLQIYNEQVNDLLTSEDCTTISFSPNTTLVSYQSQQSLTNTNTNTNTNIKLKSLSVQEDALGKTEIQDLSRVQVQSIEQIKNCIEKGNRLRVSSSNHINQLSSRSHALLVLTCLDQQRNVKNNLTIIDLAGSQKVPLTHPSTNVVGSNLQKQGSNINKSLLALGNCIKRLQNGDGHIPYRDSKLTRILKDDLSGRSNNLMIACVSANLTQIQQTINTLGYASRAANIKVIQKTNTSDWGEYQYQCDKCYNKIKLDLKHLMNKHPQQQKVSQNEQSLFQLQLKYSKLFDELREETSRVINEREQYLMNAVREGGDGSFCESSRLNLFTDRTQQDQYNKDIAADRVKDLFHAYQNKIYQILLSLSNKVQPQKIVPQTKFIPHQNQQLQKNQFMQQLSPSKTMNTNNNGKNSGKNLKIRSQKSQLFNSQERQQFLKEQQSRYDSNPRNRKKISIHNINRNEKQVQLINNSPCLDLHATQRMALDEDDSVEATYSMKETIMRKLRSARKRVQSETQPGTLQTKKQSKKAIQVSSFQIGEPDSQKSAKYNKYTPDLHLQSFNQFLI